MWITSLLCSSFLYETLACSYDGVYKNILRFKDDILQYNQEGEKVHLKMWSLAFETQHPF